MKELFPGGRKIPITSCKCLYSFCTRPPSPLPLHVSSAIHQISSLLLCGCKWRTSPSVHHLQWVHQAQTFTAPPCRLLRVKSGCYGNLWGEAQECGKHIVSVTKERESGFMKGKFLSYHIICDCTSITTAFCCLPCNHTCKWIDLKYSSRRPSKNPEWHLNRCRLHWPQRWSVSPPKQKIDTETEF